MVEGWFFPKGARLYHYGVEGRRRSLCGRFDVPGPHLLFPEVEHRKCLACVQRLEEKNRRREEDKAIIRMNETDLALEALSDHVYYLLSLFEFERVDSILEEIKNLINKGVE